MSNQSFRRALPATMLLALAAASAAQISNLPPPPLPTPQVRVTALAITSQIRDGVASTEVRQTYRNEGGADAEAECILPLPPGAAPDRFTITMNGKDTPGEVLDAGQARKIYEEIVRKRRDPGLLEYFGNGCVRARVFPIAPRGESQVVIRYRHLLPMTGGIAEYRFPLRATTASGLPTERITLECQIESKVALKTIYSPLAGIDVQRKGEHAARVSFENQKGQIPERDFSLFLGASDQAFGLSLLSTKRPGGEGYFLLLATPKQDWPEAQRQGRSITFVVDTSGSMQGQKIQQAKEALRYFLRSLRPEDFFNVVTFSTEAQPLFRTVQPVGKDALDQAIAKVDSLEAKGGTNIEDGLKNALGATLTNVDGRALLPIVVFLTDGQPTIATTDPKTLQDRVAAANASKARIFVFGVGNDVNTQLLDKIAEQSRADRDYVREDENIEVKTGALFTKLSHPVLVDVALRFDGIETLETHPKDLPDLFCGSRLVVFGRYRGEGSKSIRLQGKVDGKPVEYVYEASFANAPSQHDYVPALWAQARVAHLLDAIRLHGSQKELVDEVQRLGREFQIVTPYTSHLVLEDSMRVAQQWAPGRAGGDVFFLGATQSPEASARIADELRRAGLVGADRDAGGIVREMAESVVDAEEAKRKLKDLPKLVTGEEAVRASLSTLAIRGGGNGAAAAPTAAKRGDAGAGAGLIARRVGDRSFHLVEGIWVDGSIQTGDRAKAKKIAAFSPAYFELLTAHPDLAPLFAFSTRIAFRIGNELYEIE